MRQTNDARNEALSILLEKELGYLPEKESLEDFLRTGEYRRYQKGEAVIDMGTRCSDVFIVHEGIVRFTDMNGAVERTFAFALPGTLFMSKHSFVMDLPSHYLVEACTESVLWQISKEKYWEALGKHPDLALWMLHYAYGELYYQEYKNSQIHNGNARARYRNMIADRPEILRNVSQKTIASYLGITPEYFSRLKREYYRESVTGGKKK